MTLASIRHPTTGADVDAIVCVVGTEARFVLIEPGLSPYSEITGLACELAGDGVALRWRLWRDFASIEVRRGVDVLATLPGDAVSWSAAAFDDGVHDLVVRGVLADGSTRDSPPCRLVRGAGLSLRPTWLAFTPWTTLDDYRAMLDFVVAEGLVDQVDPVQYSLRLLVPPGSLLLRSPALRPFLGPLGADRFHYHWTHPDPRLDDLQRAVAETVAAAARASHTAQCLTVRGGGR